MVSALTVTDLPVKSKSDLIDHNFYESLGFETEPVEKNYSHDALRKVLTEKLDTRYVFDLTMYDLKVVHYFYEHIKLNLKFDRIDPVYEKLDTIRKGIPSLSNTKSGYISKKQLHTSIHKLIQLGILYCFGSLNPTAENYNNGSLVIVPTEILLKHKQLVLSGIGNLNKLNLCSINIKLQHIDDLVPITSASWAYRLKYKRSKHIQSAKEFKNKPLPGVIKQYEFLKRYNRLSFLKVFSIKYPKKIAAKEYNRLIGLFFVLAIGKFRFKNQTEFIKWDKIDFVMLIYQLNKYNQLLEDYNCTYILDPISFVHKVIDLSWAAVDDIKAFLNKNRTAYEERQTAYKAKEEFQYNFCREEFESEKKRLMGEATAQAHFAERKEEREIEKNTDLLAQLFKPKEDAVKGVAGFKAFGDIAQSFVKRLDVSRFEINESNVEEIDTVRDQNGNEFRAVIVKPNYGREKELDQKIKERQNYNFTEKFESHKKRSQMIQSIVRKEIKYPNSREYYINQVKEQFADNPKVLEKMIEKYNCMHDSDFGSSS